MGLKKTAASLLLEWFSGLIATAALFGFTGGWQILAADPPRTVGILLPCSFLFLFFRRAVVVTFARL